MRSFLLKLSLWLTVLICFFSCSSKFPLDPLFEEIKLQANDSKNVKDFKDLSLDSAILKYNEYPDLLVKAVELALEKPELNKIYLDFLKINDLGRYNKQDGLVVIAAFHKRLNKKQVQIERLKQEVYEITPYDYPSPDN